MLAQTLTDACGADPGVVCEFIFDVTGSETAAGLSELLAKPIRVVLILLAAWLVNRLVRRSINGAVDSWLERRDDSVREQAVEAEQDSLRAAAIRKAASWRSNKSEARSGRRRWVRCCARSPPSSSTRSRR